MRILLAIGEGPGCGALPALVAAIRRRGWTVIPWLRGQAGCWLGAELLRDLCDCEPASAAALPATDVCVVVAGEAALPPWPGPKARAGAVGVPCTPVVVVPVRATAEVHGVTVAGTAGRCVPAAVPLLGGGVGAWWMADPEAVCETIAAAVTAPDLAARNVLVTAGPTVEDLDPVRYLTNRSSGLMGLALALAAWRRGAAVTLVHGPLQVAVPCLPGLVAVPVRSARQMHAAVMERIAAQTAAILCAAVADFAPTQCAERKLKKTAGQGRTLELAPTPDILAAVGALPRRPFLVGFAAETHDLQAHAADKLKRKNCDLLCANDVSEPGSGFGVATNRITLLARDGSVVALPLLSKAVAAERIVDRVVAGLSQLGPT